jgi:non-specific serine/threonine protein kinase
LITDYGEPALGDFGIAHMAGAFKTAGGTFTGSPAFSAPEILSGDPPSQSSDAYGLGATLFAALTGHAAFERRSGEQTGAQFLRIASELAPDLREAGIPDDISTVVERAMSRDPDDACPPRYWVSNYSGYSCDAAIRSTKWRCRPVFAAPSGTFHWS